MYLPADVLPHAHGRVTLVPPAARPPCPASGLPCAGGKPILTYFHLDEIDKWRQLGIIAAFFAAWFVLAWGALAFVKHQQR